MAAGDDETMTNKTLFTFMLLLCACGPGDADPFDGGADGLESGTDESTGDSTGDGGHDPPPDVGAIDECDAVDPLHDCDEFGSCWAIAAGWTSWALYADPAFIAAAASDDGVLVPTLDPLGIDGDCYDLTNSDAHVCVFVLDCIPMLVRPLPEVLLTPSDCAADGPWDAMTDESGQCWGQLGTVAVALDPDR